MKVVYHNNEWYWGSTTTIITEGCVGTVELQYDNNYPTVAFIKGLSVHKSARKCGIGNTLLELCYQEALKKEMKFLQLNVLQDSWLVKWYERKGFTTIYKDEHEFTMLKSLRPRNKQVWNSINEGDFRFLISIIEELFKGKEKVTLCGNDVCAHFTKQDIIERLVSLKPQNTWKPSDEQMNALSKAIAFVFNSNSDVKHSLESLYNELKKL